LKKAFGEDEQENEAARALATRARGLMRLNLGRRKFLEISSEAKTTWMSVSPD
jgi:hypothetical protein